MKFTTNLNLKKPDYTDPVDIGDINDNMDIVDSAIQSKVDSSRVLTNVPSNAKFTDTIYTHPTGSGSNHIPSGGTVGQILKNTASGTATWQDMPDTDISGKVDKTTQVIAGNGLTGGGALDGDKTLTLGTPTTVTNATTNSVTTTGHTHALTLTKADITGLGIPATDTNTTYTAGAGLTLTGTVFTPTFGTTAGTITQGNDSRLSNARTPLAHNHTRANITDLGSVAGINTNASTANYLRGDGTWVTPPNTNTTYSAMSVVEGTTGTATSSRTVRADYLKQIIQGYIPSSLPANGGNADTVGGFTVGVSVPSNAKFTDTNTITTINGKTGTITKADIVALGIPEQDTNTVYTHPTTAGNKHIPTGGTVGQILKNTASGTATWQNENAAGVTSVTAGNGLNFTSISSTGAVTLGTPSTITNATTNSVTTTSHTHALTVAKADVGLSSVDNVKQMPISGGTATGIMTAHSNTSYTVRQVRNIILSPSDAELASMQDGDMWIKYK